MSWPLLSGAKIARTDLRQLSLQSGAGILGIGDSLAKRLEAIDCRVGLFRSGPNAVLLASLEVDTRTLRVLRSEGVLPQGHADEKRSANDRQSFH